MVTSAMRRLSYPDLTIDQSCDQTVIQALKQGPDSSDERDDLPKGYILQERYIIDSKLGSGGFGITYLAKHRYLEDIWVAIKEYLPQGAAARDSNSRVHALSEQHSEIYSWGLQRFLDEARLLRQYKHPNIVSVEDYFEANNTAYLVMNYVQGRSIQADLAAGRKFDEGELRRIVYPLLNALQLIHHDGLYHRDISPDNILLREQDDSPVLIDFGSARYEMRMHGTEQSNTDLENTPTTIYKQGYSPLEQYEGTTQGPYTDLYALGATLYQAAFGIRPVAALKRSGDIRLTNTDPLIPAVEKGKGRFSDGCLRAIDASLQLEAANRPQTTRALLDIFGPSKEKDAVHDHISPRQGQPGWRKALAAGVLILTIAAGGYQWYDTQKDVMTLPADIPTLLLRATDKFEKAPFDEVTREEARHIYLRILTLDRDNTRALAGYSAANMLKQFNKALEDEDQHNAVILLDEAEVELKRAGIGSEALEPGWQRIERLAKVTTLLQNAEQQLQVNPLTVQGLNRATATYEEILTLDDSHPKALTGHVLLEKLINAFAAMDKSDFDSTQKYLDSAQKISTNAGITPNLVNQARDRLTKTQRMWKIAQDRAEIRRLFSESIKQLSGNPLDERTIVQAETLYQQARTISAEQDGFDAENSLATGGIALTDALSQIRDLLENELFEQARHSLHAPQIRSLSEGVGLGPQLLILADNRITESERGWHESQRQIATTLDSAQAVLRDQEITKDSLSQAKQLFLKLQDLQKNHGQELTGVAIVSILEDFLQALNENDFGKSEGFLADADAQAQEMRLDPELLNRAKALLSDTRTNWQLEQVKQAIDDTQFEKASTRIELARSELAVIGLQQSLRGALNIIDFKKRAFLSAQINSAAASISQEPVSDESLQEALSTLGKIVELDNKKPLVQTSIAVLDKLIAARGAASAIRYKEAGDLLSQAKNILDSTPMSGKPLPVLRDLLTHMKENIANQQPGPDEIYPIITASLRTIADAPLDEEKLDSAEKLLRNVLGLQADEHTALVGLQAIEHLRAATAILSEGQVDDARTALQQAQQQLTGIGLTPKTLQTAWYAIDEAATNERAQVTGTN